MLAQDLMLHGLYYFCMGLNIVIASCMIFCKLHLAYVYIYSDVRGTFTASISSVSEAIFSPCFEEI